MMDDRVFRIAAREEHAQRRARRHGLVGELLAAHAPGHDHVGEEQLDVGAVLEERERRRAARRLDDVVPECAELVHREGAHGRVVLDDEDRFASTDRRDASVGGTGGVVA